MVSVLFLWQCNSDFICGGFVVIYQKQFRTDGSNIV